MTQLKTIKITQKKRDSESHQEFMQRITDVNKTKAGDEFDKEMELSKKQKTRWQEENKEYMKGLLSDLEVRNLLKENKIWFTNNQFENEILPEFHNSKMNPEKYLAFKIKEKELYDEALNTIRNSKKRIKARKFMRKWRAERRKLGLSAYPYAKKINGGNKNERNKK